MGHHNHQHSHTDRYQRYADKIRIFHGLNASEVEYILHHGKVLHYLNGQTIFHEGQMGTNLFIVLSGMIGIYSKNRQIAALEIGDVFGEMAVLNHKPRSATAAALKDTRLFTIDEKEVNAILERHVATRLLMNIIHVLSERLETANTSIVDLEHAMEHARQEAVKTGRAGS
jgi:CRP/FNR family transcriptional regulator, cyclic AMP receptor protein